MPSFRGYPACSCLVAWLVAYERELKRVGEIKVSLDVLQLIGGYSKSGGTHATGGAADLVQCSDRAVKIARKMGAAGWHRTPSQGFIHHQHLVLNGCQHAAPSAKGQVVDYKRGYNGLIGKSRRRESLTTRSLLTWQEGIKWAAAQAGATPAPPVYYTVAAGDNLTAIAKRFGVTVDQLVAWNGIQYPNFIQVGQRLRVSP